MEDRIGVVWTPLVIAEDSPLRMLLYPPADHFEGCASEVDNAIFVASALVSKPILVSSGISKEDDSALGVVPIGNVPCKILYRARIACK
jgi:hypothetical protein